MNRCTRNFLKPGAHVFRVSHQGLGTAHGIERAPLHSGAWLPVIVRVPSETSTPEATLTISGSFSVERAQELLDILLVHGQGEGPAWVDALDVSRIDTAGLQLLTAAVIDLQRHGRAWRWLGVSAAIYDAAQAAGLQDALKLPARVT